MFNPAVLPSKYYVISYGPGMSVEDTTESFAEALESYECFLPGAAKIRVVGGFVSPAEQQAIAKANNL
jgi:hypothetical protein